MYMIMYYSDNKMEADKLSVDKNNNLFLILVQNFEGHSVFVEFSLVMSGRFDDLIKPSFFTH